MNFDFIFLIRKETRTFFQRFFCGLPLHSFYYLSKSRDALAERIKIFSNFLRIKNWQNFAFFIFWRQSHQSYIVWPPPLITTYINHKPISLLEKKTTATKNTSRKLLRKNGSFHRLIFSFWSPLELLALALIAAMDGVFLKLLQPWCESKKCG